MRLTSSPPSGTHLALPQFAVGGEGQAERVAVADRPELRRDAALRRPRIARCRKPLVGKPEDFAEIAAHVLRGGTASSRFRPPASQRPASTPASARASACAAMSTVPVFGLGCAGGVSGLALASRLAVSDPGTNWLFVTVETCSISIRLESDDPAAIVATALFGDGAAAAVVRAGEGGLASIMGSGEKLWPDTLGIMGWRVDPGLAVVFDRAVRRYRGRARRGRRCDVRQHADRARGHRPLLLPSRRRQGDRRDRNRASAPPGRTQYRA